MDLPHSFAQILTQVHALSRHEVMPQAVISDYRPAADLAADWLIPGLSLWPGSLPGRVFISVVTPCLLIT